MRIGAVRSFVIGYSDPNDHMTWRMSVLVRVETTDGVVGWGEGIAMWRDPCFATKLLIDGTFAPLLIKAGEITIRGAWDIMRAHCWWYGEGGIACFAYSALDMALWDIEGKIAGKPLYELFGGLHHQDLPAYAANHVNKPTLAENIDEVLGFKEQGYAGCKLGFGKKGKSGIGKDPDSDVDFVRQLRAAVGDDFELVVDVGNGVRWDRDTGIRTTRRLAEYDIKWIEEPFYPTQIDDYKALKAAVDIPIGGGEREWTVSSYRRTIESGTIDVLGVDPARAEGVTGFRMIDELCGANGIAINAHAWSTGVLSAASLHLSLASPNARLIELKPIANIVLANLVERPIRQVDGRVAPPTEPGLGIVVDETIVREISV